MYHCIFTDIMVSFIMADQKVEWQLKDQSHCKSVYAWNCFHFLVRYKCTVPQNTMWISRVIPRGGYSRHYEPPGQNVSIVSQICLIFVSNCLKRSKFCLKHVSDKMSQFGLNLRPFWHLRHNWDCPYLRAIWEQFETFFCVVKKVSKRSQTCLKKGFGGFSGSMVDRWSFQVPSLYIQTLWFHN